MEECQICVKCNIIKPFSKFSNNCNNENGKMTQCKQCISLLNKAKNNPRIVEGTKICSMCKVKQDVINFNSCKTATDGLYSSCKKCAKNSQKKWLESNIKNFIKKVYISCKSNCVRRSKNLVFAITEEDILELYYKQDGKCAISCEILTKIALEDKGINKYNVSIDRINSSKGYTKDNIQLVGAIVNIIKNDIEEKDFILFVSSIVCVDLYNKKN
jgi:hypothetical protein